MAITQNVFSEAEVSEIAIKVDGATKAEVNKCVGTIEEEMESKTISKKCAGVVTKKRTKGTGNGTLKISLHMAQDLFASMYGMDIKSVKDGVTAYGQNSLHPVATITAKVEDEDGNVKYKAYPKVTIESGISRKIENGQEEIAEIEIEAAVSPDEFGNGLYEAVESDITDEDVKTTWMESFTPALVQKEVI